jgi:hypothetical protein
MDMFQRNMEELSFSSRFYNSMPTVEDADAEISQHQKLARAAAVLAPIYAAHDVIEFCGINLLHAHWRVHDQEFPEQTREPFADGAYQLVTRPTVKLEGLPASWTVQSDGHRVALRPFEFSSDRGLHSRFRILSSKADFFAEAAAALVTQDLHKDFGICIAAREPLSNDPNAHMVEISEPIARCSTVRDFSAEQMREKTVLQTIGRFATPNNNDSACVLGACIKNTSCESVTAPDGSKGAHATFESHDKEHEIDPRA